MDASSRSTPGCAADVADRALDLINKSALSKEGLLRRDGIHLTRWGTSTFGHGI